MSVVLDLFDGILDKKYYDLDINLYDTLVLSISHYEFKERYVKSSCELFEVEVSISDDSIKYPYLFKSTYSTSRFTANITMIYWRDIWLCKF